MSIGKIGIFILNKITIHINRQNRSLHQALISVMHDSGYSLIPILNPIPGSLKTLIPIPIPARYTLIPVPFELKAGRPHPRNYPHTLTDYRHTDNPLRLVRPNGSARRAHTDAKTDGQTDATKYIISPLCNR